MSAFRSMSRAMTRGYLRDRMAVFFTILFPLMFLVVFGGLFKDQGLAKAKVVQIGAVQVLDAPEVRAGLDSILKITRNDDTAAAIDSVRKGDYAAAIEEHDGKVVVHFSGADQVRAGTVLRVMESLIQRANLEASHTKPVFSLDAESVEDQSLQTIQYVTPGLLGWAIATGATFGAALTLVTWRQKKILRRLRLAPVSTWSVIGARVGVSVGIALVQTAIFLAVAIIPYFGLKLAAYWWMCVPVVIAGTLAFLSVGLLAGAFAKTPEAASGIAQLVVLPMAFLSGSFFPIDNAPTWLQHVAQLLPMRYINTAMQDVMVRGAGPASVLPEIGILLAFAVVVSAIASRLFRWDDV